MKLYCINGHKVWFLGLDPQETMDKLSASGVWKGLDEAEIFMIREEKEIFRLDPGGLMYTKVPFTQFEIGGLKFEVQPHRANHLAEHVANGAESDGLAQFNMWWSRIIVFKELRDSLIEKLREIAKSDSAIHAEISVSEAVEDANKTEKLSFYPHPVETENGVVSPDDLRKLYGQDNR